MALASFEALALFVALEAVIKIKMVFASRCVCLHWYNLKFQEEYDERVRTNQKNCVSVVEGQHDHRHDRPKLKPQVRHHHSRCLCLPSYLSKFL